MLSTVQCVRGPKIMCPRSTLPNHHLRTHCQKQPQSSPIATDEESLYFWDPAATLSFPKCGASSDPQQLWWFDPAGGELEKRLLASWVLASCPAPIPLQGVEVVDYQNGCCILRICRHNRLITPTIATVSMQRGNSRRICSGMTTTVPHQQQSRPDSTAVGNHRWRVVDDEVTSRIHRRSITIVVVRPFIDDSFAPPQQQLLLRATPPPPLLRANRTRYMIVPVTIR